MSAIAAWPRWPRLIAAAALACAAAPAAAEPALQDSRGATEHDIKLVGRDEARPGEARALSLTIAPRPEYSISQKGPLSIDVTTTPGAGIELQRQRYHRQLAADARADAPRFDLRYTAVRPGQYELRVELRFWVCGNVTCWPVRALRTVALEVRSRS